MSRVIRSVFSIESHAEVECHAVKSESFKASKG